MTTCYKCPGYDDPGCCCNLARLKDPVLLLGDEQSEMRRYAVVPPTPAGNRQERRALASKARKGRP